MPSFAWLIVKCSGNTYKNDRGEYSEENSWKTSIIFMWSLIKLDTNLCTLELWYIGKIMHHCRGQGIEPRKALHYIFLQPTKPSCCFKWGKIVILVACDHSILHLIIMDSVRTPAANPRQAFRGGFSISGNVLHAQSCTRYWQISLRFIESTHLHD